MAHLHISDLHVETDHGDGAYPLLQGVNLVAEKGRALGIVGESGSGKTLTCLSILRLLPSEMRIARGRISVAEKDVTCLSEEEMQSVRGNEVAMIFQDARAALNPVLTVGEQIADVYRLRRGGKRRDGLDKAAELMDATGIPQATSRLKSYPHELSGGMCQRVLIAMALASRPKLLLADEITSGLDVTIQAQVLDLLDNVVSELQATLVLVSHDLSVVSEACTDVAVMYGGLVLEQAEVGDVMSRPLSPYSRALVDCYKKESGDRMHFIPGSAPQAKDHVLGCPFSPRCEAVIEICRTVAPNLREIHPGHLVACHEAEAPR